MIANSAMSSVPLLPKVAITGLGLVTPLGTSKESFFAGLSDGRSALALHSDLSSALPGELAGQPVWAGRVSEFGAQAAIEAGKRRRMPRLAQMCIVAAREALGLLPGAGPKNASAIHTYGANRLGVVLGTGLGGLDATIEFTRSFIDGGMAAASPAVFPYTVMNASAEMCIRDSAKTSLPVPDSPSSSTEVGCTATRATCEKSPRITFDSAITP